MPGSEEVAQRRDGFAPLLFDPVTEVRLCVVHRAVDAGAASPPGLVLSLLAQDVPYRTNQVDGEVVHPINSDYLDSSITHLVLGYIVAFRFGVSRNGTLPHPNYLPVSRLGLFADGATGDSHWLGHRHFNANLGVDRHGTSATMGIKAFLDNACAAAFPGVPLLLDHGLPE